ncbi:MAG: UDP-2,3-diacylglucosamine diphosphatase [Hydrogenophilales bacterium CG03_land_8_20_14_0_80_62_28]|nr:UDP-2,3-diacylglucosamine diphosphatase [Betaproteobacteria bacterium]OIO78367.1 MAG: UDP-2,3-diacylglucosamine diphosphatase [Hydrogenophilaceae bacterium CG1_02_62_390]PIV24197.1 MAG: UDP-2,3-diacylglucosamine diphosphatase [Hydrogenophilales bacterium CG03_land_8_20_14_0_80_62_28]PIW37585.1 MAG: UDP-2,3-diacylglucosamine diphosphatase [Hydrogenophilales bacterium CG15_BIG_FIL_POST_REV_8_21_14_020_62_31]PIW70932.1 MAG: UDP-2,3-diacylglucosamine diphosphatase [Hydrogenophilales bacterium CG
MRADTSLFISDLHLAPDDPASLKRFLAFLAGPAGQASQLYILGDLFETWVGDDDLPSPLPGAVCQALRRQADAGLAIFIMHGNRDFLLGEGFCQASSARLLPEPALIDLHGAPTLLMHGDSLCSDDLAYQQFRRQVRDPVWQQAVLARPLAERRLMASQMLDQSSIAKGSKTMVTMDVNQETVAETFRKYACPRLIHGHTHRPARHGHLVDGHERERWILPDWYEAGGYLRCDGDGCRLLDWPG